MAPPRAGEQSSGDSAELADCIAVIRSLVLIRKQLTTLRDINDEYKAMEGEVIPYTRFGFSSLEEMLRRSEEFNISRQLSGAIIISARLSRNDEHMARLVQETQSKKPLPVRRNFTSSLSFRSRPPMPLPRFQALTNRQHITTYEGGAPPQRRMHPRIQHPEAANTRQTSSGRDLREVLNSRRGQNRPINDGRPKFSVCDRLKVTPTETIAEDSVVPSAPRTVVIRTPTDYDLDTFDESLNNLSITSSGDPVADLVKFCEEHGLGVPHLEIYSRKVVGCRLTVDGKTYFEYAETEEAAKELVARTTLMHLRAAQLRKSYPVTTEEKHDLAVRLHDLLLQYPHGVLEKDLPEIFQRITKTSLPDQWANIVHAYSRFFCVESGLAHVVYANELNAGEEEEQEKVATDKEEEAKGRLPWKQPHWNLYVTHVLSTTMIWARIIGEEFSERWDHLMTDIEQAMTQDDIEGRVPVPEVVKNNMYLVQKDTCWYRVRCQDTDDRGFLGLFVDQGNEEWLSVKNAFHCEDQYQSLPGQAVLFTVFGLESMEENPHAKEILERTLLDKAIVAEILTKEEDHSEGARVKALLFDTSGEEDVNLAEQLHDEICAAGKAPQLKKVGLTHVTITHVSDRGDVYCQVPGTGMEYVQKVIEKLSQNEETLALHQGLRENVASGDSATRYLVHDRQNSLWARAVLKVRHRQSADHMMYCLDTGVTMTVAEKDIYQLAPLSKALGQYPAMAVRCELFDVPKMDSRTVSRVKGLLQVQSMALAKVMVGYGCVPQVNFYQRIEVNKVIVCINDTIRMEHDFETSMAG